MNTEIARRLYPQVVLPSIVSDACYRRWRLLVIFREIVRGGYNRRQWAEGLAGPTVAR